MSAAATARQLKINVRSARGAAERRRKRTGGLRYRSIANALGVLSAVTLVVVVYLGLLANVTRLGYERSRLDAVRGGLVDDASRLDDQIAILETRDRLASLAGRLGMREPRAFTVALIPAEPQRVVAQNRSSALMFVPAIASWLR